MSRGDILAVEMLTRSQLSEKELIHPWISRTTANTASSPFLYVSVVAQHGEVPKCCLGVGGRKP